MPFGKKWTPVLNEERLEDNSRRLYGRWLDEFFSIVAENAGPLDYLETDHYYNTETSNLTYI